MALPFKNDGSFLAQFLAQQAAASGGASTEAGGSGAAGSASEGEVG